MPSIRLAGARMILLVVAFCPKRLIPSISWLFFHASRILGTKDYRTLSLNIRQVFRLAPDRGFGYQFAEQVCRHQIECGIETIQSIFRPGRAVTTGLSELHETMQQQRSDSAGMVLVTAHLGSWELLGMHCAHSRAGRFNVLAKEPDHSLITDMLEILRRRMGTPVIWTGRQMVQRRMLKALRAQEWLGFVMDQKPAKRVGPVVHFFDRPTEFVSGPAAMAARTNCSVMAAFCIREAPFRFSIRCQPLLAAGHDLRDVVKITQICANSLEDAIRTYPEQWCWNYKRWADSGKAQ